MEQPSSFVAQEECVLHHEYTNISMILNYLCMLGLTDLLVFYFHVSPKICMYSFVYFDDIVIKHNDGTKISQLKNHLCNHFQTKDIGLFKYFMGIEVVQAKEVIVISQRKFALDI